jgi:predicted deacylase
MAAPIGITPVEIAKVEFAAPRPGPRLLVTGGVHGDEFEPMAAVRRLIGCFRAADPPAVLKQGTLTLVPVVNEAAFLSGARTAPDGLDLARTCPGKPDGSLTERTAHALSQLIRAADAYIDLHSGGTACCVLPMTGYSLHTDPAVLERQRAMARAFNLPIVWGTTPALEGRSLSVARDAGVAAIYAEYGGSGRCDPRGVAAYVAGCLNVMALLEMIDAEVPPCRVEHTIEDPRADSGHMQICNPAPLTGHFEPAVELGQRVAAGELLGTVTDILARSCCEIRAQQSGIVLVLRTFPRVLAGESVGVILET